MKLFSRTKIEYGAQVETCRAPAGIKNNLNLSSDQNYKYLNKLIRGH